MPRIRADGTFRLRQSQATHPLTLLCSSLSRESATRSTDQTARDTVELLTALNGDPQGPTHFPAHLFAVIQDNVPWLVCGPKASTSLGCRPARPPATEVDGGSQAVGVSQWRDKRPGSARRRHAPARQAGSRWHDEWRHLMDERFTRPLDPLRPPSNCGMNCCVYRSSSHQGISFVGPTQAA